MIRSITWSHVLIALLLPLKMIRGGAAIAGEGGTPATEVARASQIEKRPPWTTSRITGIPDPPPFRTERVFPHLQFGKPVVLTKAPGSRRWFVAELAGRIFSFPPDPDVRQPDLFVDLAEHMEDVQHVYGVAFHPDFERNRFVYICYLVGKGFQGDARVSRFRVRDVSPPQCDPASERLLLKWKTGGHNGGCLKFGPDGYLYISTGDGASPSPPDPYDTGQSLDDLKSAILRIDVDRADEGRPYGIPEDNPFVGLEGARPEIWAYGLRNPWKMNFDRVTGDLWLGDVGWESWEMVQRVERGGNHGWSVMEGPLPIRSDIEQGPTPILPPTVSLSRTQAASVTGGFVYRGKKFPQLEGAYIFGDYETRKVWATRVRDERDVSTEEIATTDLRLITFGEDEQQELYLVDYDEGTIHQLTPRRDDAEADEFPRKLSETGLFSSVREHAPEAGVVPFAVNVPQWADHATAERLVAVPNDLTVRMRLAPTPGTLLEQQLGFPEDSVLVRTFSLEMERDNPASRRRIESQILHFDGADWHGYSYRWNEDQTDATLVETDGAESRFSVADPDAPNGQRVQTWTFHGRAQCARCHNAGAGYTLAFNRPQLDLPHGSGHRAGNQLHTLQQMGVLTPVTDSSQSKAPPQKVERRDPPRRLVDPSNDAHGLDQRARSYLHVNCSHCHQAAVGGNSEIDLRAELPLEHTKTLNVLPLQGTFGLHQARIISPGDPYSSVLMYRLCKTGRGRMPRGSGLVDREAVEMLHAWIERLQEAPHEGGAEPPLHVFEEGSSGAIEGLLTSTNGAVLLQRRIQSKELAESVRQEAVKAGAHHPQAPIRDLFEAFIPPEERIDRLDQAVEPRQILAIKGEPSRGKELFFNTEAVQCKACHCVAGQGGKLGPDLSTIGRERDPEQLLQSVLEPSREIEPRYLSWLLQTTDGQVYSGLLESKTDQLVILRDRQDRVIRIPTDEVDLLQPQQVSLMPELMLQDMTASEIADLLAYLSSLR